MFKNSLVLIFSACLFASLVACSRYSNQKTFEQGLNGQPYDVIIVPGYPYAGEHWNSVVKMRVLWAHYLYTKGYAKNVIFSGSSVYSPYVESKIMAMYAIGLGIPKEHIFVETKAEHTTENIYYSYCIAKKHGFKKIALATDPYQSKRMRGFLKNFDLPITIFPIVIDTLRKLEKAEPYIDKNSALAETSFIPLPEREGKIKRLKGTFGQNIKWQKEDLKTKKLIKKYKHNIIDQDSITKSNLNKHKE